MFPSGTEFFLDEKDGIRGYNTSATRGADTFYPFSPIRCIEKYLNAGTHTINLDFKPKSKIFCVSDYGVQSAYYDVQTGKIDNGTTAGAGTAFSITVANNNTIVLKVTRNINVSILYY